MVRGLDLFRERFREYEGAFVLIGGAACHEWLAGFGAEFRPTKDLDIVLIVEMVAPPFVAALRSFIDEGKYEHSPTSKMRKAEAVKTADSNEVRMSFLGLDF